MAVDSRNKRFSILGLAQVNPSVLPNPDGAIDSGGERAQYLWLYSGIALSSPTTLPTVGVTFTARRFPLRTTMMRTPTRTTKGDYE